MHITKEKLSNHTSLRIGGEAECITVRSEVELMEAISYANTHNKKIHILGGGTNTFFGKELPELLVVKMEIKGVRLQKVNSNKQKGELEIQEHGDVDSILVTVNAGEVWDDVVRFCVDRKLWGLENLSYIPGTVGAAPVQNIGAYGVELSNVFYSAVVFDRVMCEYVSFTKEMCMFDYRDSLFKRSGGRYIILSVTLALSKLPHPVLTYKPLDMLASENLLSVSQVREAVITTRKSKIPDYHTFPNAGSFFKNPTINTEESVRFFRMFHDAPRYEVVDGYKIPAAWLIERVAHMKGVRVGDVGTWPNQPLVIVNYGNATAEDMMSFSKSIIEKIYAITGITLEREVQGISIC